MAISLARVAVNTIITLVLPAYLTHHLPLATYGAWVLILQFGAYVSFLDLGIQTGVAKFVAEFDAKGDSYGAGRHASAGLAITIMTGLVGVGLTLVLAWQVPRLFQDMPTVLYRDVRISIMLIGVSLSLGLVSSVFSAVFMGLQRYAVPTVIAIVNRLAYTVVILAAVFLHSSLAVMGAMVAAVNVAAALLQMIAWRKLASRIQISLVLVQRQALSRMARYCSLLAVWTVGMVCVSGMDVTIVGHYAYNETAYYSVASLPITFMLVIISSMLGPMMPASSALSTQRSPMEMGALLSRLTRYSATLLLLTGLPLVVFGFPILRLWVGPTYAIHSISYLQILVIANIIRNLCAPYATLIAATDQVRTALAAPILEAVVNLGSSLYLASRFGAMGVAYGTLLGAFASVALHFAISMHYTISTLAVSRAKLFVEGITRPALVCLPSLLLLLWQRFRPNNFSIGETSTWAAGTILLAWFGTLNRQEHESIVQAFGRRSIP
ncbi:lipopolysaccharide biosynthesis protein [Granulicella arctica]|uniref:lipopolysaccharide biosynthesis protein n=1 Tax=Granulicella arctica TaxID=940613 RepID=UPI0021DF4889|nr:polysaccharide biosynthesis C-terminal domain-containing protein [Granulicella arctica]